MTIIIVIVSIASAILMIWCAAQQSGSPLRCVVISPLLLMGWREQRPNLIVIELRNGCERIVSEALVVPARQLDELLRWVPPQTTLVFCGRCEFDVCRSQIATTLVGAGIDVVFIVDQDFGSLRVPIAPDLIRNGDLN